MKEPLHAAIGAFLIAIFWAGSAPCFAQTAGQSGAGFTTCVSCHGAHGEGNAAANFPRLAGQPASYLSHQLRSYADGSRNNQVMGPIAKGMSAQQIEAAAAYYASLSAPSAKTAAPDARTGKRGVALAEIGDDRIGVQACSNCHGPGGMGEAPSYPYLAGQHAGYLTAALAAWKNGSRNNDPSQQMVQIAKRLSDSDAAALAAYFAAQMAPAPVQANVAAGSAAKPAAGNAKSPAGTAEAKGEGTEQGAPTSGGGQGPGGGGAASGAGPTGSKSGNAH